MFSYTTSVRPRPRVVLARTMVQQVDVGHENFLLVALHKTLVTSIAGVPFSEQYILVAVT